MPAAHIFHGRESIQSLKERAALAIPAIGKHIQTWSDGVGAPASWKGTLAFGLNRG